MQQSFAQTAYVHTVNHIDHESLHEHRTGLCFGDSARTHIEERIVVKLPRGGSM